MLVVKASAVLVLIAGLETIQGILRIRLLNRRVGDRRARQIGVVTGSVLIVAVAMATVGWIGIRSSTEALGVGLGWLAGMLAYDVIIGRVAFRSSWERIAREFKPSQGGYLAFGMVVLLAAPWLAFSLRH